MTPLTLQVAKTVASILNSQSALQTAIAEVQLSEAILLPTIVPSQVVLSSASPEIADVRQQIGYPRVSIYVPRLANTLLEKFRSLSGVVSVVLTIAASADLVEQVEQALHYYVDIVTGILRDNTGDWGNGLFFAGAYDVQLQAPDVGGLGFVQTASITCSVSVGRS
jgi:hypothetical protein